MKKRARCHFNFNVFWTTTKTKSSLENMNKTKALKPSNLLWIKHKRSTSCRVVTRWKVLIKQPMCMWLLPKKLAMLHQIRCRSGKIYKMQGNCGYGFDFDRCLYRWFSPFDIEQNILSWMHNVLCIFESISSASDYQKPSRTPK